jgi:hypothetical protein
MDIAASGSKILGQHPAKSAATTGNQNSLSRQIHLSLPHLFSLLPYAIKRGWARPCSI